MVVHSHAGMLVLAIGGKPQFLSKQLSSQGCLSFLAVWSAQNGLSRQITVITWLEFCWATVKVAGGIRNLWK